MQSQSICPFCNLSPSRIISANSHGLAIFDGFPVLPGHALIVPKRHIASLFEATKEEREALFDLLAKVRERFKSKSLPASHMKEMNAVPDAFNIGINDGTAAGQTVMHLHIHLIPRYTGDQADPRGGVRWIFPDKAAYWNNG